MFFLYLESMNQIKSWITKIRYESLVSMEFSCFTHIHGYFQYSSGMEVGSLPEELDSVLSGCGMLAQPVISGTMHWNFE